MDAEEHQRSFLPTMSFIKLVREILSTTGMVIVFIGTTWLAVYYGFVVHAVPDVDFGKLVLLVGLVGAVGTWFVALLLVIMFASPAVLLSYYVLSLRPKRKNVATVIPTVTYQPQVIGVVHYAWLALWTIVVLAYADFAPVNWRLPQTYALAIYFLALVPTSALIGCFDKTGRFRFSTGTAIAYWLSASLWSVSLLCF